MDLTSPNERSSSPGVLAGTWAQTASLRAGILAGAVCGALIGGAGGRIVMRMIFLVDQETEGARTDFGTVGEISVGSLRSSCSTP